MYNQSQTDPSQGYQNQVAGRHWVLQFGQMGPKTKSGAKFEYEICLWHRVQLLILNIAEHELRMYMPHSQPQNFIGVFNVLSQWYQLKCFMWRVTASERAARESSMLKAPQKGFFCEGFSPFGDQKKKAGESNKGNFEIFFKNRHILREKNQKSPALDSVLLQVARIKQDSKKDLLVHQDSRHLLLINAEDPSQCTYLRNLKKKTLPPRASDSLARCKNDCAFFYNKICDTQRVPDSCKAHTV